MTMHWNNGPDTANTARETRVSKLLSIEISSARHSRSKIVIRNLSPHGIGARSDLDVIACEHVTVHMPNDVDIGAIVRWVKNGAFGLSLDERIEPDMLNPANPCRTQLTTSDSSIGFQRIQHEGSVSRSGFQRSHRQQVLNNSRWLND
ncbi:MAG: hypothetical protein ABL909_04115 [Sphingopyxis sp.]